MLTFLSQKKVFFVDQEAYRLAIKPYMHSIYVRFCRQQLKKHRNEQEIRIYCMLEAYISIYLAVN